MTAVVTLRTLNPTGGLADIELECIMKIEFYLVQQI